MAEKRPASNAFSGSSLVVKRPKSDATLGNDHGANGSGQNGALVQSVSGSSRRHVQHSCSGARLVDLWTDAENQVPRTSGLQAPIMELTGHSGEIFAARFDPAGHLIASGSMDRSIFLWRTYGNCDNFAVLSGHKGAVLDLQWSRDSHVVFSASADATVASWDIETGQRIRRHIGHEEIVNCLDVSRRGLEMLVSGGDDGNIGVWDPRQKFAADHIETDFPITAVALAEAGNEIYTGGIDNDIKVWDIRKKTAPAYTMPGHTDTITSLNLSPDSQSLLSHSHDGTVRTWDIRPFAPTDRSLKTYDGAPAGLERNLLRSAWDPKGEKIAAGSGDRTVVVWDVRTGKLLYKLPGHKGTVNDVRFSPADEPILLSASSDRTIMLGELGR